MPADIREKYVWAPGTTENVNAKGKLDFSNISVVQVDYEEPTIKPSGSTETPTTGSSGSSGNQTVIVQGNCKCNNCPYCNGTVKAETPTVAKPAKPVITAKNVKGKKIQVAWKKVANAKKYQVRAVAGKKTITKTTSKTKIVLKKLQKKTYKVSVRAYGSAGYGKWSKAKKVKVKK